MNIRRRLSILYSVIWAGLYLLFTLALFSSFNYHLREEVDESLASWSARMLGSEISPRPEPPGFSHGLDLSDTFAVVFTADGRALFDRTAFPDRAVRDLRAFVLGMGPQEEERYGRSEIGGQRFRVLARRAAGGPGTAAETVVFGRSLVHVERTVRGLVVSLLVAWLFAVAVGSTVMWLFVGNTLKPIQAMRLQALAVTGSGDLSGRVEEQGGRDEFSSLARALNRMLSSLQASADSRKQFLADVSHELRSPLTSIRANLEFMRRATGASEEVRGAALADSIAETDRMAALVNDLLVLARVDSLPPRVDGRVDLAAVAADAAAGFRGRGAPPRRRLDLSLPALPACASGDAQELRQALVMLLDNAFKYSAEDGSVALRLERNEGRIRVTVDDDGPGIPPQELGSVFDRFYRASNVRDGKPGSGLGLAIVRSIVQRHGGTIELRNREPHGLSVTILLPACP